MRVSLYRNRCIACGYCLSIAPELWMMSNSDGKITIKNSPNYDDEHQKIEIDTVTNDKIEQSAKICPVNAIKLSQTK